MAQTLKYDKARHLHLKNEGVTDVVGGTVQVHEALVGVANITAAPGELYSLDTGGIHDLPKASEAVALGARLYWDADGNPVGGVAGSGCLTATATDNTYAGIATAAALEADAVVEIKLNA